MEEKQPAMRPVNPRRRKKTPFEIFKEAYLPMIIACTALLIIVVIVIGSIVRGFQHRRIDAENRYKESVAAQEELDRLTAEANTLLTDAAALAMHHDYEAAAALLKNFSGDPAQFPQVSEMITQYQQQHDQLVLWEDPSKIVNLSFQVLITDPERAYADANYGSSFKKSYVTTSEFSAILDQLYTNQYILIRTEDYIQKVNNADGTTDYTYKELYLPAGKKPLILTQTNVNYNLYMVDGDGDKVPDKDGSGFANKLLIDENGNLACEYIHPDGTVETGAFDLIPILESFLTTHPDFSYKGARAVIALTGYNGLFGYRTNQDSQAALGEEAFSQEILNAKEVSMELRRRGYELACYTYRNVAYGNYTVEEIAKDLAKWNTEAVPILGAIDMFVFAKDSDIAPSGSPYSGEKYQKLYDAGFRSFIGFSTDGTPWALWDHDCVRQGRLLVNANNLTNHPEWFTGILDATVLDPTR